MHRYRVSKAEFDTSYTGKPHPSVIAAWRNIVDGLNYKGRTIKVTDRHLKDASDTFEAEQNAVQEDALNEVMREYAAKFPNSDCSMMNVELTDLIGTPI